MQRFGIDISEYQKGFDFDKAIDEGVEFAIIRGADRYYKDSQFEWFYQELKKREIPIGVYHYARCTTVEEAEKEAAFLIENVLKGKTFEYPVYMDVETDAQRSAGKTQMTAVVIAYCEAIKKAGYTVGIYASLNFINQYLDDAKLYAYEKWIAQWNTKCDYTGDLGMWQFGGETNMLRTNKVAGVVCDQNFSYKDYSGKKPDDGYMLSCRILRQGNRGENVRALQVLLMGNGWDGGTWKDDGIFGMQTMQAVKAYQEKKKLAIDGIAGPETMGSLLGI